MFKKKLIVVGDHVMVRPDIQGKTRSGLYLPPSVAESDAVMAGWVVEVGPGAPIPYPVDEDGDEPWMRQDRAAERHARYVPPQAEEGDFAIFLRRAAVEITFEEQKYLIVPNSAVLALVREELKPVPNPAPSVPDSERRD